MSKPFTARPYQTMVTNHILDTPRCAVWAGMGMGKSCATLNAISALQIMEDMPTLVLAPLRVARDTWPDEGRKWDHTKHLKIVPIVGTAAQRLAAVYQPADIHTINYENLPWLVAHYGDKWPYRMLVLDESTKVKGFRLKQGGMRAKALAQVAHLKVKRLVELTGTPASNGLKDLWGQAWFLDVGQRLGRTYSSFTQRWFRPSPDGFGIDPLAHSQGEIQDRMRDLCITVEAKDWFDLREPIVTNVFVDLPMKARKQYAAMEKEMFLALDSGHEIEAFNAASRTVKCLQIANGAAYVGEPGSQTWETIHDEKIQALESIVEESAGSPVLVAYHFKSDLARLKKAFPAGQDLATAKGMAAFKTGQFAVGFGHPAGMGHGVDGLQEHCHTMVYFGHWWDLEQRLQVLERVGPTRQFQAGKDRAVFVYNIVARDTVDEQILERIETKRSVQDILMAAMKQHRKLT